MVNDEIGTNDNGVQALPFLLRCEGRSTTLRYNSTIQFGWCHRGKRTSMWLRVKSYVGNSIISAGEVRGLNKFKIRRLDKKGT